MRTITNLLWFAVGVLLVLLVAVNVYPAVPLPDIFEAPTSVTSEQIVEAFFEIS